MATVAVIQNAAVGDPAMDREPSASFVVPLPQWAGDDRFLDQVDDGHQAVGSSSLAVWENEYDYLKEEVFRKMLTADDDGGNNNEPIAIAKKLRLIDAIQRLGVGYHYETEIKEVLEKVHALGDDLFVVHDNNYGLYITALRFRLLRQQGFPVSSDGFRNLKDSEGKFKEWLASDVEGLLSLYEAAHVAVHGEDILDEALSFATNTLKAILPQLSPCFQKQVKFALGLPSWKCVPRSLTKNYIDFYSEDATHHSFKLLRFTKLDFNMLQKIHQQELRGISEWWKSLDVVTNFPDARDRVVECYYWIYAVYFEPKHESARIMCTKIILMLSLLDDTCDNFATYEEVEMLAEAIESFHVSALEPLPDTMKSLYRIIIDLYDEIEMELAETGPTFAVDYAKEELKKICRAHLAEVQRWSTGDHVPTLEEYKIDAYVTSGFPILCTSAFVGMGAEIATREAFEWVTNEPKMVRATSVISRIQKDILSYKWERERSTDHGASAIECYMKEHGASEEEAVEFCWEEISRAWKDIAEECQKPTSLPVELSDRVLNFARSISVIYENGDRYTHSRILEAHIDSLFSDPFPL